jgi:hypothetical protein
MNRRRFVLASGSAVLGSNAIFSTLQRPVVSVSFDIVKVPNIDPKNTDSIMIDFDNFRLIPYYVDRSDATIEITVSLDDHNNIDTQTTVTFINGEVIDKSDIQECLPMFIDGISSEKTQLNGYIKVSVDHPSVNDSYKKNFTVEKSSYTIPENILNEDADADSGSYRIKPNESIDRFKIYCEMNEFGGGWGLVGKSWGKGDYNDSLNLTKSEYLDRIMNVNGYNESELEYKRDISGVNDGFAFLSKNKMNALFNAGARMFRVEYKGGRFDDANYSHQVFITPYNPNNFDAWHAIRDTRVFGNSGTCDKNYVDGLGSDYAASTDSGYDSSKNEITNSSTNNCGIGHWDDGYSYERSDGVTYSVSRHGISGDISSNYEWLFVISPNDSRHPHGVDYNHARVWLR